MKEDIRKAVNEGRYLQGEECKGTVFVSYTNKNGEVEGVEAEVCGSKIPPLELRNYLLQHHAKEGYMPSHKTELEECQYGESGCGSRAGEFLSFARITSKGLSVIIQKSL